MSIHLSLIHSIKSHILCMELLVLCCAFY
ncbi:hypothetical protein Anas_01806 [Armadillidium nasatum]|uniref:Uncharacterized protein n=1 Tax=Armadillidium nasatum TaxID=96803 RepID=A0A5N5SS21_9CRUS|nr:hypothetical protein Anas_01806 [Armadillidium nasatum]